MTIPFSSYESLSIFEKKGLLSFFSREKAPASLNEEELYSWESGWTEMQYAFDAGRIDALNEYDMYWSIPSSGDETIQAFITISYLQGYHA
jgi:hypothetical protein